MIKFKKLISGASAFLLMLTTSIGCNAMQFSDDCNGETMKIGITGQLVSGENNRNVAIVVVDKDKDLTNSIVDADFLHYDSVKAAYDGSWSYSFKSESGDFDIYAMYGDNQAEKLQYTLYSWGEVLSFFENIQSNALSDDKIYNGLLKYELSIGKTIPVSATDARYKTVTVKRIKQCYKKYNAVNLESVKNVINNVYVELDCLKQIQNSAHSSEIGIALSNISTISDYTFNCSSAIAPTVYEKMNKQTYADIDAVYTAFTSLVSEYSSGGSGGSGGSGASRGSGGSSVSTPSIPTQYVINPDNAVFDGFIDISDCTWAKDAINYLSNKKILNGTGNNCFEPNGLVTREQLVKMVVLAYSIPIDAQSKNSTFIDIDTEEWYTPFVAAAVEAGIIKGIDGVTFGVGEPVTRQDLATVLYRCAVKYGNIFTTAKTDFADFNTISDYAVEPVSYLAGKKIINGFENNTFMPFECASRAQTATMLYKLMGGR